jgi:mono/diheme cytochrome c family protein
MSNYLRLIAFLLIFSLFGCNKGKDIKPFTTSILKSQNFLIDNAKDTVLNTIHGSKITIPAGSFSNEDDIEIEIKEAFTAIEIFASGMTTESNGELLRSAGMIYVNAKKGDTNLSLTGSIKVSLPNNFYDSSMRVYQGVDTNGVINWVNPTLPDTTPQIQNLILGKNLYNSKCATCHNIFKKMTGPALADVEYRGPWTNRQVIADFLHNPMRFTSGNRYLQKLKAEYGSEMIPFPALTKDDIDAILDYIKNETAMRGSMSTKEINAMPIASDTAGKGTTVTTTPPCKDDTIYFKLPEFNKTYLENAVSETSTPVNDDNVTTDPFSRPGAPEKMESLREGFTDPNSTAGTYDFEIRTLGWYNIDVNVEGYPGTEIINLIVDIQSEKLTLYSDFHVYLFIPQTKMLSVMNAGEKGKFRFDKIDGGIPLTIGTRAILFAFGSVKEELLYSMKEFIVQKEQTINLQLNETTDEEIKAALLRGNIDGIDIGVIKKERKIIENFCDDAFLFPEKDSVSTR